MEDYVPADGQYVTGEDSIHRAYPFRMTARDMARFGLLYLRSGRWNGKQIVPEAWIKESTRSYSDADSNEEGKTGYGYMWWVATNGQHLLNVKLPDGTFSARGADGHYILVVPAYDLVVVHRVDTDIEGRKVTGAQFGELVRRILLAYTPPAPAS
jgi:CubicO group peptidase (beta-lactamase class C family)